MLPVICKIGPLTIYSYGLIFALASFVCIFLLSKEAKRQGFNQDVIIDLVFWVLVSGIIGARIFYIIFNASFFLEDPKEIFMLWHGGLVWYGGLIGSIIFAILFLKFKKFPVVKTLDLIAPYAALGQAIGRVGCFLNGCCFGRPSGIGIYFPVHQMKLFPIQLLSSFNLFLIFILLSHAQKKQHKSGEILFLYLILASLERFIVEFFRGDSEPVIWGLTIFQVISLVTLFISINGEVSIRGRKRV